MKSFVLCLYLLLVGVASAHTGEQPLSKIAIHRATLQLDDSLTIKAYPVILAPKVLIFFSFWFCLHSFS